jgi:1,2-dihydroxy-3-keto-5-methylthiopentene dioxygenase
MSLLKIYPADRAGDSADDSGAGSYSDAASISQQLQSIGVRFERWQADVVLDSGASQEAILAAYQGQVAALMADYGFASADVISLKPDHPERQALRQKFLDEHTHSDFEVRFFVAGQGLFYIHHENRVYAILCQQGDLISVPAGARHWFDMGPSPSFTCIRLFTDPEGWVADYTGDTIAARFPRLDQFVLTAA